MNKDIAQLICNFLTPAEFYIVKNIYGLSANNYIDNANIDDITLPIDGSHDITHDFIMRNMVDDEDVIDYALKFDKPGYIKLSYVEDKFWVTCNMHIERVAPQICEIPNIIIHNYKENGLRLPSNYLDVIFANNCIELMKLVQDYPEKSNLNVFEYRDIHNNLWDLNYKHKIAHLLMNCPLSKMCCNLLLLLLVIFVVSALLVSLQYKYIVLQAMIVSGSVLLILLSLAVLIRYIDCGATMLTLPI